MYRKILFTTILLVATKVFAEGPIVINIDSPEFKKLVTAIPPFKTEGQSPQLAEFALGGQEELGRLLEFTEFFKTMPPGGYQSILAKPFQDTKALPGFQEIDLLAWKAIQVDSLTLSTVKADKAGHRIDLKTADIRFGTIILEKSYQFRSRVELDAILRRYADLLLVKYTGKPGIFTTRLVFVGRKTKESKSQIYTCDIDGKNMRQMTKTNTIHISPSWSPDGNKILFTSYAANNPDLYQLDIMTNQSTRLASAKGINSGGVFTHNSKLIAYSGSQNGETELYLRVSDKAPRVDFLKGNRIAVDPVFSPNGKWLAYVSGKYGNPHIFRVDLEWNADNSLVRGTADKQLTFAGWWNANPAWSPDSKEIVFAGFDKEINRFDIFIVDPETRALRRLTTASGSNVSPNFSPNGQLIVFASNRIGNADKLGKYGLYIMSRDGRNQRALELDLYEATTPKWGPYLDLDEEIKSTSPVSRASR